MYFVGLANSDAVGVQVEKVKAAEKKKKVKTGTSLKRQFKVLIKHKSHNKISKKKKNSQSKLSHSVHPVGREVNRVARILQRNPNLKDKVKRTALRRLQRLHATTYVNKTAKKDDKKKQ